LTAIGIDLEEPHCAIAAQRLALAEPSLGLAL